MVVATEGSNEGLRQQTMDVCGDKWWWQRSMTTNSKGWAVTSNVGKRCRGRRWKDIEGKLRFDITGPIGRGGDSSPVLTIMLESQNFSW